MRWTFTWGRAFWLAFFLLCLGSALGLLFPAHIARVGGPVVNRVVNSGHLLQPGSLRFALVVLVKNCLVLLLVLLAGPCYAWLKGKLFRPRFAAYLSWITAVSVALFPAAILVLNGAVLSWSVLLFWKAGVPLAALLGGILPHGVFELAALLLGSALAFYRPGGSARERLAFFLRPVVPLLLVASLIETYVSPVVMAGLWA